jgi:hypothetical protein
MSTTPEIKIPCFHPGVFAIALALQNTFNTQEGFDFVPEKVMKDTLEGRPVLDLVKGYELAQWWDLMARAYPETNKLKITTVMACEGAVMAKPVTESFLHFQVAVDPVNMVDQLCQKSVGYLCKAWPDFFKAASSTREHRIASEATAGDNISPLLRGSEEVQ